MKKHIFQFSIDHMVGRREIELLVSYSVTPGMPETPPAYDHGGLPADPDEFELISITHEGRRVFLSDTEEEALLDIAIKRSSEDMADAEAEEADYRYEEYRERILSNKEL